MRRSLGHPRSARGGGLGLFTSGDGPFASLAEMWAAARRRLDAPTWDFFAGGAGTEQALSANVRAFERVAFVPRVLRGLTRPSLKAEILGIELEFPVIVSPFGGDTLFHPEGALAVARAAAATGTVVTVAQAGSHALETIAEVAPAAARLMELHPTADADHLHGLAQRAAAAGYTGLVITVDSPSGGCMDRNLRNRFEPGLGPFAGNSGGRPSLVRAFGTLGMSELRSWDWEQVAALARSAGIPWIAKGVLHPADAEAAYALGASAVWVSNHGARQLDCATATLDALPAIASVAHPHRPLLDGGVRRGSDVVKAIALGAGAVGVGRLAVAALAAGGEAGVAAMLRLLREGTARTLLLLGARDLDAARGADLVRNHTTGGYSIQHG